VLRDLTELGALRNEPKASLIEHLKLVDKDGYWGLLQALDKGGLGNDGGEETLFKQAAPLFGRLPAREFAKLATACKVRQVSVGQIVLREGERGTSLFGVGRGRLVVHCLPGSADGSFAFPGEEIPGAREILERTLSEAGDDPKTKRIYLSALGDGELFGEFSFLTGRPRSATVETITDCLLVEIDHDTAENVLRSDPAFKEPLLDFYKERVGELMMAKNPVFAILSPDDRRELLTRSQLKRFRDEEEIVREGEISEDLFFIKHGEVEVYREDGGIPVFINKLREGEFFGEMAALHGTPRSASVRAMGDVELFRILRSDLEEILLREDRLREILEAAIQWRAAEAQARVAESRRIFEGT
jgi:CRP-like cAMP-binding protein